MNKLFIDTSDRFKSVIKIESDEKILEEIIESQKPHSEKILYSIEKICKEAGIDPSLIEEVIVNEGPGSYTGLRVGISIANTLALSSGAKVNGREVGKLAEPVYS